MNFSIPVNMDRLTAKQLIIENQRLIATLLVTQSPETSFDLLHGEAAKIVSEMI